VSLSLFHLSGRRATAIVLAVAIGGALTGCVAPRAAFPPVRTSNVEGANHTTPATKNLEVFDAVWNHINRYYYDAGFNGVDWQAAATEFGPQAAAATDERALYRVINAMLDRLNDGHTGAAPASSSRDMRQQQVTGIGIRFMRIADRYVVSEVFAGGPAKKAGIMPGWLLLSRDGVPIDEARPLKRGQVATWAFQDLTGSRVELALAAQEVSVVHREARTLPNGIGYIRFDEFDFDSVGWLRERIRELMETPGLVVDLRANSGGAVVSGMYALGHFLDPAEIVMVTFNRGGKRFRHVPLGKPSAAYRGKLAVLVSGASASGSEIFAAAIQEQHRGIIVGQKTAGAVLEASRVHLPDQGVLQYSDSDLVTARGVRLENVGVAPDISIAPPTLDDLRVGRDRALERAIESLAKS
jgi:carboxyl-terminal processing protease